MGQNNKLAQMFPDPKRLGNNEVAWQTTFNVLFIYSEVFYFKYNCEGNIFGMAAMPFPCNGPLCFVVFILMFFNKFASCYIPYLNFFIGDGLALALKSINVTSFSSKR